MQDSDAGGAGEIKIAKFPDSSSAAAATKTGAAAAESLQLPQSKLVKKNSIKRLKKQVNVVVLTFNALDGVPPIHYQENITLHKREKNEIEFTEEYNTHNKFTLQK